MKRIPLRDKLIPHGERLKEAFWQLSVASSGYAALDTLMEEIDTRITTLMDTIDQIPDGFVLPRKRPVVRGSWNVVSRPSHLQGQVRER